MSATRRKHVLMLVAVLGGLVVLQAAAGVLGTMRGAQYYIRILYLIEINIILTVSLALVNGFTGQFSIGHAGFMAVGAYTSVIVTTIVPRMLTGAAADPSSLSGHALFIVSLFAGGVMAGAFGLMIGLPTLRLRGDYLAIVTLAAGEVIRALLRFSDSVGGPRGVSGIPKFTNAAYLGVALVGSLWLLRNTVYSHFGRACVAVRDNEIAAGCVGINPTFQKVGAFVLGAFFAGIAGGLFAHLSQYINPDNFSLLKSLDILIFLYIGGAHSLAGGILGATLFTMVPEALRLANLESWRMVVYPLVLIIAMRFRREGIMGRHEFGFLIPWGQKEMRERRPATNAL